MSRILEGVQYHESILETANGVFRKGSPWYSETKTYPNFDIAKATELVNKYKADHGGQAPKFALGITKDALNREANMDLHAAIEAEAQIQASLMTHADFREAYDAFVAKRAPKFS